MKSRITLIKAAITALCAAILIVGVVACVATTLEADTGTELTPTPRITELYEAWFERGPDVRGESVENIYAHFLIPGWTVADGGFVAAWNGHAFELLPMTMAKGRLIVDLPHAHEVGMDVYHPIDQRTKVIDWQGATGAYKNETNTAWLPILSTAEYNQAREVDSEVLVISMFQPELDTLDGNVMNKLAVLSRDSSDSSARSDELAARVVRDNLLTVRGQVVDCMEKKDREKYVGFFHQYPKPGRMHAEAAACIQQGILLAPITEHAAAYLSVDAELKRIHARLTEKHAYETRWAWEARLKAEAAQ